MWADLGGGGGTWANAKKKKKTLTHDPRPTPQLVQDTWPGTTGKKVSARDT